MENLNLTKPCRFFNGKADSCRYGDSCLFLHSVVIDGGNKTGNNNSEVNRLAEKQKQVAQIKNKAFKDFLASLPKEIFDEIIIQLSVQDRQHIFMTNKEIQGYIRKKLPKTQGKIREVINMISDYDHDFPVMEITVDSYENEAVGYLITTNEVINNPQQQGRRVKHTNKFNENSYPYRALALPQDMAVLKLNLTSHPSLKMAVLGLQTGEKEPFVEFVILKEEIEPIKKVREFSGCTEIMAILAYRDVRAVEGAVQALLDDISFGGEQYSEREELYLAQKADYEMTLELARKKKVKNEKKITRRFIIDFKNDPLEVLLGRNINISPISFNQFGCVHACQHTLRVLIPDKKVNSNYYYCWNASAPIKMADGTYKLICEIVIGDEVMSANGKSTTVKHVKTTKIFGSYNMVQFEDFLITPGHPMLSEGEWYRPDELYQPQKHSIDILYNLYCEPYHEIIAGKEKEYTFSSLGGYCPRIAEKDPYTDFIYGRGWGTELARRYEWLLNLERRVPDNLVEPLTILYWKSKSFSSMEPKKEFYENNSCYSRNLLCAF